MFPRPNKATFARSRKAAAQIARALLSPLAEDVEPQDRVKPRAPWQGDPWEGERPQRRRWERDDSMYGTDVLGAGIQDDATHGEGVHGEGMHGERLTVDGDDHTEQRACRHPLAGCPPHRSARCPLSLDDAERRMHHAPPRPRPLRHAVARRRLGQPEPRPQVCLCPISPRASTHHCGSGSS